MKIERYEGIAILPTIVVYRREWVLIWLCFAITLNAKK